MRLASVAGAALLFLVSTVHASFAPAPAAPTSDTHAVLAVARQRVETTDARATGRLVRVDAGGKRVSNAIAIKAHWFPGVLRVLLEIVPARTPAGDPGQDARESILLEMRPSGQSTIRIFHPHETAPVSLPFDKWNESVSGTDFNYEDFLQSELYWKDQALLKTAKLGTHDCDVLQSKAGGAERSHYAEVQTWFDRTTGYPIYAEKTLKSAATVKEFTSLGVSQSGGVWTARQVEVKVHGRPGSTQLLFERGSTKANLTLKDFSPEQIEKFEDHP